MAYCVKCGVELADSEKSCPLCNTVVAHPDVKSGDGERMYPSVNNKKEKVSNGGLLFILTVMYVCPAIIVALCDLKINSAITWSGFVISSLVLVYVICVLPIWFKKPHPVVFMACDFIACAIYLAYINFKTQGNWFFTFALPVVLGIALATCVLVSLVRCVKNGKLYVVGGFVISLGLLVLMIELLMEVTFDFQFIGWSLYPLVPAVIVGILLIYLAINPHVREKVERRLFF